MLGEPRVFEVCRAAAEACVEAGLLREGTDLVRAIVRRKKLLTPQHAKELQVGRVGTNLDTWSRVCT